MKYMVFTGGWLDYANDHGLPVELPNVPDEIGDNGDNDIDEDWVDYDTEIDYGE